MVGIILNSMYHNKLNGNWNYITEYINEETINKYKELFNQHEHNKLEDNTAVYLTPLSTFPSYKLKNYIEENNLNIKTGRKLDIVNALIINYDFIFSSYIGNKLQEYYIIPADKIIKNPSLKKYIPDNKNQWQDITVRNGLNATHYFISPDMYKNFISVDNNFSIIKEYPLVKGNPIGSGWGNKKVTDNVGFFLNLFENIEKYNLKIIFDSNINNAINEGLPLDEEIFENIINMINSEDKSNINLAKEIMANLDYKSSEPYFIYLFNYFYKLSRNESNNKNYDYLKKQLKKHTYIYSNKHHPAVFDNLLPILIKEHPNYSQEFMNCFRIHMNILFKKNIIKEIIVS
jgi:hypothetical protein